MDWLEAALAFAVTMMVLSTMVSGVVEMAHRVLSSREKGLRRLMTHVYEDVIAPRICDRIPEHFAEAASGVDAFVERMIKTHFLPVAPDAGWWRKLVYRSVNAEHLKELDTMEFMKRLGESAEGQALMSEAGIRGREYLDRFLTDVADKFEAFGASASDYFQRRARLVSGVIAIGLAFTLNVSAVDLFTTYLQDKDLRDRLIARGDDVAGRVVAMQTSSNEQPPPEITQALKDDLQRFKRSMDSLRAEQLPIGWSSVPWESDRWQAVSFGGPVGGFILWFFSVLLAGVLIGLGGPFWFDIFRKLGALTGIVGGLRGSQPAQGTQVPPTAAASTTPAAPLTDAFQRTIVEPARRGGRPLLSTDGSVDQSYGERP